MKRTRVVLLGLWISLVGFACATSPLGRKQLLLLPDSQMDSLGAQAFEQVKAQTPPNRDPKTNQFVKCVALPITDAAKSGTGVMQWDIVVFEDPNANAFALPGGKIGVNTGLLSVAKTDAQLAAVIGHEVGHVIAKHGAERMSEGLVQQFGLEAIGTLSGSPHRDTIMGLLGIGAQYGLVLPHSRTQESESDAIGLDLMARAGFDPRQSIDLWHNMGKASSSKGGAPPEWLSTHPSNPTRIEGLQERMPEALRKYQQAQTAGRSPRCVHP